MKKKFGFTLAEVLITLGIIGVVAALTAPALVKDSGQAKIGPSLAKFANTIETGCEQLMSEENVGKLSSLSGGRAYIKNDPSVHQGVRDKFMNKLAEKVIMTPNTANNWVIKEPNGSEYMSYTTQEGENSNSKGEFKAYTLKDGSTMLVRAAYNWSGIGPYKGGFLDIIYDINGPSGNNKIAKEVFRFLLDENGILVPYGSNQMKYLHDNASNFVGEYYNNQTCNPEATGSNLDAAFACTGAIADNGWKADY